MKPYTITTTTTTTITAFLLFFLHHPRTFIVFRPPPPPHRRKCFTYPTLLPLLQWKLINYLFFLFTFSPPHRPHVDPTVNFYLNKTSWIVKLYTITTNSTTRRISIVFPPPPPHFYCFSSTTTTANTATTTRTFLWFSLLLIFILSVWNGSLLTMEFKRRKLKTGCPHCVGNFQWGTIWHFLCKPLTTLH